MSPDGAQVAEAESLAAPVFAPTVSSFVGTPATGDRVARRDATVGTLLLLALVALGSGGFASFDRALLGYFGASLVSAFGVLWRVSAFWRRPASAFYARAMLEGLRNPRRVHRAMFSAVRDLGAQDLIRQRSRPRWLAHLLLSFGTLVSFAITLPLVFGWMHFVADGERHFRMVVFTIPAMGFDVDGPIGWLVFHALSLAALAVALGAAYFLALRLRHRRLPGATASFAMAPLVLLLFVALSGLAMPASRSSPVAFRIVSALHELLVVVLLVALPSSKLAHVLVRPLQVGARLVRSPSEAWRSCLRCGARLAPIAQQHAVAALLESRAMQLTAVVQQCPACRRKQVAAAQTGLVGAPFQPWRTGSRAADRQVT
jgi:hypothetical protein